LGKRREHVVASIHQNQRKTGTTYTLKWRDPESDRAMDTLTFATRQEAEMWKRLLDGNGQTFTQAAATYEDSKVTGPTINAMILQHVAQLTGVGPYQIERYKKAARDHFGADLGGRKTAGITHDDIVQWIRYMEGKGLSAKTIANQHGLLSATMQTAIRQGIRETNPCKGVKLPKTTASEDVTHFITHEQWAAIMEGMGERYRPFYQLLVGTGLRFSEASALKAADFNLDAATPTVRVTKAWKMDGKNGWYVGPPKTRRSIRTVSLAPSTVQAVRGVVEGCGDGYVFRMVRGGAMRSSSLYTQAWRPGLLAAGFTPGNMPRMHDIRHTHASWMIAAGMEIFALSRRLGHESITTTMDRYSHLLPDAQFTSAAVAAKALEG
jgi:integrase